jgi:hypothetical protein
MRNGNNKRMRGRNNRGGGGGKGPNPLSRSYESNGPDVKIRGTAQHIAEKYLQLARDAHSSGDPVAAESYLQHAEHYFRIIAAAHEQLRQQQAYRQEGQPAAEAEEVDEGEDDDDFASPFDKRFEAPVFVRPEPPPQQQPRDFQGGQRDFQGGQRDFQGERRDFQGGGQRDFQGERRDFQGGQRDFQGGQRDFQGQGRGDRDRFPGGQRPDRQDRPRFQPDPSGAEQPDLAGAEGDAGQSREGQRPDGRPYESRRERFERRRAERFAERQSRRDEAPEGDEPRAAAPARDEEADIGLPSFITGGAVSAAPVAPAAAPEESEAPAPKARRRRTPRVEEDTAVVADPEKTPAAE